MAKKYVTVLLSGEGSDECFAGYPRFGLSRDRKLSEEHCIRATTTIPEPLRKEIFPDSCDELVLEERREMMGSLSGSSIDRQRKYEILTYFPELLVRQNKMAMANSIENRVPFLDNDLVEYVMSLDGDDLIDIGHGGVSVYKAPLKYMAIKYFDEEFVHRKKVGFSVPIQNYIKTPEFKEYFYDGIMPALKMRGLFNAQRMTELYENISVESYNYNELECFWRVLTAEIFYQLYFDI